MTDTVTTTMDSASPFHAGEIEVQTKMGVRGIEAWARKIIRPYMPDQHREFFAAQPFLIVSARDESGRPWATILEGEDGFVASPDPARLEIKTRPTNGDALQSAFAAGADIGLLGLEMATRRRNRVNGHISDVSDGVISFTVDQSFGNCPQYIRERGWWRSENTPGPHAERSDRLTEKQAEWVRRADTFFIASGHRGEGDHPSFGMDVSHRGGDRGFVEVLNERRIRFPDYAGNKHYNTLGNLLVDARAGFLFLDFTSGSLLQMTGRTELDFDSSELDRFPGALSLLTLEIEDVVELRSALRLRWDQEAESARSLRLVDKKLESADVMSFVFEARDGGVLAPFKGGQHLPIELRIPGVSGKVQRTYSLSGAPADPRYRISVKREAQGLASRYLHDDLQVGAILDSRNPAGGFETGAPEMPLVLVSAGIGITPMLSLLHQEVKGASTRSVWFVHGARDGAHHPFRQEIADLVRRQPGIRSRVFYSQPRPEDRLGHDFSDAGRISGVGLLELVDAADAQYLLCGPSAFMADLKAELESLGVPETQILFESF